MGVEFNIVIPARFASVRLPGKPLLEICGRPMIEWVYRAALEAEAAQVVVATDDQRIAGAVDGFGGVACLTGSQHQSGTDRILEVTQKLGWGRDTLIVNLQGDEPLMPAENILQVAQNLHAHDCMMATLHKTIDAEAARDPNLVKLVHDINGYALYFSRAPIPYDRSDDGVDYRGHIGIYAYRAGFIETFNGLAPSPLEMAESLEQLRALDNGFRIHSEIARADPGPGIDTGEDLERVRKIMAAKQV